MKQNLYQIFLITAVLLLSQLGHTSTDPVVVRHDLTVDISPALSLMTASDVIDLSDLKESSARPKGLGLQFTLHKQLHVQLKSTQGKLVLVSESPDDLMATYALTLAPKQTKVELAYSGIINHPVDSEFSPGTISADGVALMGSTYWFPVFGNELFTAKIHVRLPNGWQSLTQGLRSINLDGSETWEISQPTDMLYLMAGRWQAYQSKKNKLVAQVLLRNSNSDLADTYLSATHQYVEHYSSEIGPYPYSQFTLLENFWETGYGMPAFTLLGPKVIRLPFIIYSSYPHEILHNWWGNSVFIDFDSGNWAEGLTTYMADHWLQVQRGQDSNYRRTTLQQYKHYVRDGKDFPLIEFKGRHDSATKAVGYGKSMMFFHMLRNRVGESKFKLSMQSFYNDNKFKYATYWDIHQSFESIAQQELLPIFEQWLTRTGAPKLSLNKASLNSDSSGHRLTLELEQSSKRNYDLVVPIQIELDSGDVRMLDAPLVTGKESYQMTFKGASKPVRVSVDPNFDLFRWVYESEIPAALSSVLGEDRQILAVLPRESNSKDLHRYQEFVNHLQNYYEKPISVIFDDELGQPRKDTGIWALGWNNKLLTNADLEQQGIIKTANKVQFANTSAKRDTHSVGMTFKRPDSEAALFWLSFPKTADLAAIARKLPHYGKYSHLIFHKSKNISKGQWATSHSPLTKEL